MVSIKRDSTESVGPFLWNSRMSLGNQSLAVDHATKTYKNYVPQERPNSPTSEDLDLTVEFVKKHMPGVEPFPIFCIVEPCFMLTFRDLV